MGMSADDHPTYDLELAAMTPEGGLLHPTEGPRLVAAVIAKARGIGGVTADVAACERMNDCQEARGPDGSGVWARGPVALGHRRLSIIDLSVAMSARSQACRSTVLCVHHWCPLAHSPSALE